MKTRAEIMQKLEELGIANLADDIKRRNEIHVPPHRVLGAGKEWNPIADQLEAFGFEGRGMMSMSMEYSDKEEVAPVPSLREQYAKMSEADQMKADMAFLEIGGWLSEEKFARLRNAGLIK